MNSTLNSDCQAPKCIPGNIPDNFLTLKSNTTVPTDTVTMYQTPEKFLPHKYLVQVCDTSRLVHVVDWLADHNSIVASTVLVLLMIGIVIAAKIGH